MQDQKHKWSRNDTILAFELYCFIPKNEVRPDHPQIVETAKLIGTTSGSLHARLQNFKTYDPSYTSTARKGLTHGSKSDAEIVSEFLNNSDKLVFEIARIKSELGIDLSSVDDQIIENIKIPQGYNRDQITNVRIGQYFFRKTILASYNNKCCITGLSIPQLLRASHIKPWSKSDENEKTNPQNGLLLNVLFDSLFDKGLITIDANYNVVISSKIKQSTDEFIHKTILPYSGTKINLPQRFLPDVSFLQYHNEFVFQKD